MVWLVMKIWGMGNTLNSHYFQDHFNQEWQYLLESHLWVKSISLKLYVFDIYIHLMPYIYIFTHSSTRAECDARQFLIPYNCELFVIRILTWSYVCLLKIIIIFVFIIITISLFYLLDISAFYYFLTSIFKESFQRIYTLLIQYRHTPIVPKKMPS